MFVLVKVSIYNTEQTVELCSKFKYKLTRFLGQKGYSEIEQNIFKHNVLTETFVYMIQEIKEI